MATLFGFWSQPAGVAGGHHFSLTGKPLHVAHRIQGRDLSVSCPPCSLWLCTLPQKLLHHAVTNAPHPVTLFACSVCHTLFAVLPRGCLCTTEWGALLVLPKPHQLPSQWLPALDGFLSFLKWPPCRKPLHAMIYCSAAECVCLEPIAWLVIGDHDWWPWLEMIGELLLCHCLLIQMEG